MSAIVIDHPRRRASDLAVDPVLTGQIRRVVGLTAGVSIAILLGLVVVAAAHARSAAEDRFLGELRESGDVAARVVVAPLLTTGLLAGDADAVGALDERVAGLSAVDSVAQVTVSALDGTVVWSDRPELIGTAEPMPYLDPRDQWVTRRQASESAGGSRLIDIHTVLYAQGGDAVVVTVSYPQSELDELVDHWWSGLLPLMGGGTIALGALVVTPAVVIPRRSLRHRRERELMLERVIVASDTERRRIAGEVHDGAVQDLIGVTFGLGSVANATDDPMLRERIDELADTARATVTTLRSLLSSIYPVRVPESGWVHGLTDLTDSLRAAGVHVELDVPDRRFSELAELLMLRVAREALRNVVAHSGARSVRISLVAASPVTTLTVVDDGRGFDPSAARSARRNGHFGLQLIRDLACELGAALAIDSRPGAGTSLRLEIGGDLSKDHR